MGALGDDEEVEDVARGIILNLQLYSLMGYKYGVGGVWRKRRQKKCYAGGGCGGGGCVGNHEVVNVLAYPTTIYENDGNSRNNIPYPLLPDLHPKRRIGVGVSTSISTP